jgi:hypothetical protein
MMSNERLIEELRKSVDIADATIRTLTAKLDCMCGEGVNHLEWDGSFPHTQYDAVLDHVTMRAAVLQDSRDNWEKRAIAAEAALAGCRACGGGDVLKCPLKFLVASEAT